MRRSARQVELPLGRIALATLPCRQCARLGATIIVQTRNAEQGAREQCWCSIGCARRDGWPWLSSESGKRRRVAA